ncbi:aminoglycoside adenylyltransferase domain-containing protein [Streptomyces sp. NBC_01363]|uniref:aminoglycoside adenylyltransferase domain-containing protein n=1 Tax=Streptomyces sp. NBC_01363 TaxID=2903840 RepID=UPI00224C7D5E|nr:aminoglycoside adenylyltransferase domain-containing protein [Streptomyces sp. NBC_01363]MCX4734362.1 DUF4111 domain-containing protein [Streptomyces sp. NBC_01363]
MSTSLHVPPAVLGYAADVASVLASLRSDLVGVYLHGSAVLGGFHSSRSDIDVLAVVEESGTAAAQQAMGEAIAATARQCPGTGLEMSVITAATASVLGACLFEVHINTTVDETEIVTGAGGSGDPDLILHSAVCRSHAISVLGPMPARTFGPVPRDRILAAMVGDLQWALDRGSAAYAVLNACRAIRFAEEGRLCSKLDGAEWYTARHPDEAVVTAAMAYQRCGDEGPNVKEAAQFVAEVRGRLRPF